MLVFVPFQGEVPHLLPLSLPRHRRRRRLPPRQSGGGAGTLLKLDDDSSLTQAKEIKSTIEKKKFVEKKGGLAGMYKIRKETKEKGFLFSRSCKSGKCRGGYVCSLPPQNIRAAAPPGIVCLLSKYPSKQAESSFYFSTCKLCTTLSRTCTRREVACTPNSKYAFIFLYETGACAKNHLSKKISRGRPRYDREKKRFDHCVA